ncbi:hypothetical protein AKJ09_06179 [Labilithrix luteola]|uniref:Uncharacterized protein n=1 Tax=Labilithrix luteola TaxID=1391654 RepID=A0A0K1Q155_9BACT|nr:hypothetical protein [Labilithrix luteola]AKU99515.1 hypothetical protein AKJ09_06179 [Labilithrix luteola]
MTMIQDARVLEWDGRPSQGPFAETTAEAENGSFGALGFQPWNESLTPFADEVQRPVTESDRMIAEAVAELHDESFDEAIAYLAEETEQAVADRFDNELPSSGPERERYADAHLSAVRFEANQYVQGLESALEGMDVEALSNDQLDEVLERLDPRTSELTPAGEEFIGSLVRKAKKAVKFVANTAKNVVKGVGKVAGALLGPVLQRLRGLVNPLLRRVLSFAIGRLPAALQPAARTLASRISLEAGEEESLDDEASSPANRTDVEALAESFDLALAEAMSGDRIGEIEHESYDGYGSSGEGYDGEEGIESRELEVLAEARGVLIDRLRNAGDEEDVAPAVEQFVPALLGALRLGIQLVGRPKVVGFLARYIGQLIRRWVGPKLSQPLSNAIVDTGLRLITLESEADELASNEAGPIALASVVEDTVRRLAESEEYVFENEDLMQLATAEAFGEAVASHFPPRFVRPKLQQATSLGGTFVARRPRSVRTYRKYSRIPEVEVTAQIADTLPTFGGSTLGAVLRAAGVTFPIRARLHIYQAAPGTTLPRMVRMDRTASGRGYVTTNNVHPLTPGAAGLLLREPRLGVAVPAKYLRSRHRIAVGQRFYALEPMGAAGALALPPGTSARAVVARVAPSRAWTKIDLRRSRITVGFYLSEADAQSIVPLIRQGRGAPALLQTLTDLYASMKRSAAGQQSRMRIAREDGESFEDLALTPGRVLSQELVIALRRRLRAWVLPALATWARTNGEAFARAAAHPDAGVTIRVRLTSVPGLDLLGQGASALRGGSNPAAILSALRGTPTISITVDPGRHRR